MRHLRRFPLVFVLLFGGAAIAGGALALAQDAAPAKAPAGKSQGDELIAALQASPGCLGVESAFTRSRKSVVFAWFKDKAATLEWFYGDYHQTQMMALREAAQASAEKGKKPDVTGGEQELANREPLAEIPDDQGPILCIATITPASPLPGGAKPLVTGFPQPITQISIELYAPLPGGISVNGRFAPASVQVPHLIELAPQAGGAEPKAAGSGG
jgi:hypothetical protein